MSLIKTNVKAFAKYLNEFIEFKGLKDVVLLGNSLGGHIGLYHTKTHPETVKALVITGSSGLYEMPLNLRKKSINFSKILILGIAYKKDVNDTRESPSIEIIDILKRSGAVVDYSDPYVPVFPNLRKYKFKMKHTKISPKNISIYDAVVICTNHSVFDYEMIIKNSKLIIDTRGVLSKSSKKIVKA